MKDILTTNYPGKYISMKNHEIIAVGDSVDEVVTKTKRILNKNEKFRIEYIERGDLLAY